MQSKPLAELAAAPFLADHDRPHSEPHALDVAGRAAGLSALGVAACRLSVDT